MRSPSTGRRILRLHRARRHRAQEGRGGPAGAGALDRTLFSNLPGMAYRCRNDGFWTMEFVSAGCRELTGYDPEELVGNRTTSFEAIIEPGRPEGRARRSTRRRWSRGEPFELTYRIRTRERRT
jgi:PAS domain-containing protein